jgi:spermidine/putrescine-binding protein
MDGTLKPASRIAAAVVLTVMALSLSSCTADSAEDRAAGARVVNIYNWSDYIAAHNSQF